MKRILCFGDSNTWGFEPATGRRFSEKVRWPCIMAQELGEGYHIIEEALNGRTTVHDDPVEDHKNGKSYLKPCLESHAPLDSVVIALGVNDLKARFSLSASDIADGVGVLVNIVQRSGASPTGGSPEVVIVAPPKITKLTKLAEMFDGAEQKSRTLAVQYRRVADKFECTLLNADELVTPSELDGIHLEQSEHQKLGKEVARLEAIS